VGRAGGGADVGFADTFGKVLLPEFSGMVVYLVMAVSCCGAPKASSRKAETMNHKPPPPSSCSACCCSPACRSPANPSTSRLAAKTLVLAIFAMSLDLLVGFTGLVSFGHAAYFGVAAYAVALLSPSTKRPACGTCCRPRSGCRPWLPCWSGFFVLRTKGIYFIMVTLAFAQLAFFVFHDTALGGGSDGIYLNVKPTAEIAGWLPFDLDNPVHLYYFILAALVGVYAVLARILQSPFGRVLVGIKSNEHRMQSLGY
jgi:ABC-type branched-subunit amino acid transport system permease subunit